MNTMPGNTMVNTTQAAMDFKSAVVRADTDKVVKQELPQGSSNVDKSGSNTSGIDEALEIINKVAIFEQRSLSFMFDEASGRSIIKVVEKNTNEVIRQIPSEELLKVAQDIKRLQEEMGQSLGLLVDSRV